MRALNLAFALAGVVGLSGPAFAGNVFSDDFDNENGGTPVLNFGGLSQWTVSGGTIDLIGNGYFDFLPGNGLYIDLDGSTFQSGQMLSKSLALGAGTYTLSFDLAGSHRGNTEFVDVGVATGVLPVQTYSRGTDDAFQTFSRTFTLGSAQTVNLVFQGQGNDNIGLLLDNVSVDSVNAVPLPPAVWLGGGMMAGMAAFGIWRRRRAPQLG